MAALAGWTTSAATLHVRLDNPNPMPPSDSWANVATNIQDAVDATVEVEVTAEVHHVNQANLTPVFPYVV